MRLQKHYIRRPAKRLLIILAYSGMVLQSLEKLGQKTSGRFDGQKSRVSLLLFSVIDTRQAFCGFCRGGSFCYMLHRATEKPGRAVGHPDTKGKYRILCNWPLFTLCFFVSCLLGGRMLQCTRAQTLSIPNAQHNPSWPCFLQSFPTRHSLTIRLQVPRFPLATHSTHMGDSENKGYRILGSL